MQAPLSAGHGRTPQHPPPGPRHGGCVSRAVPPLLPLHADEAAGAGDGQRRQRAGRKAEVEQALDEIELPEADSPGLANTHTSQFSAILSTLCGGGAMSEAGPGRHATVLCDACNRKPSLVLVCSACRKARYCSPECQRCAWPEHKAECRHAGT